MASDVGAARSRHRSEDLQVWSSTAFDGIVFSRGTKFAHPYPRHWHEEIHFCAYTSGSGYLGYRGNSHLVTQGDFIITPPGEVHENWVTSGSDISFRGGYIDLPNFRRATQQIAGRELSTPDSGNWFFRDERIRQKFLSFHRAAEDREDKLLQEELLLEFLQALLSDRQSGPRLKTGTGERRAVASARQYIEEHFREPISLADLGHLTNLSPYHLHRVFSKQMGMPPHAYQTQVRINHAKQLLRNRQPLSAIALSAGFSDQSHLTRHFHRLVGVTPGRYLS